MTAPLTSSGAVAAGLATIAADGTVLDTWFPAPALTERPGAAGTTRLTAVQAAEHLGEAASRAVGPVPVRGVEIVPVRTVISSRSIVPRAWPTAGPDARRTAAIPIPKRRILRGAGTVHWRHSECLSLWPRLSPLPRP